MNKIIVIGCPGGGKSYFSKQLARILNIPLYHLDMIWHNPDKTNISKEELKNKVEAIIQKDCWIIDGNYQSTLEQRFIACDTIFLLDFPLDICLNGALSRIGKKRDDLPWIEEEADEEFIEYIKNFPNEQLPYIYELLDKYSDKTIIIFKSRNQMQEYIKKNQILLLVE